MARDQTQRPLSDEELEDARKELEGQREEIKAYLDAEGVDVSDWDAEGDK